MEERIQAGRHCPSGASRHTHWVNRIQDLQTRREVDGWALGSMLSKVRTRLGKKQEKEGVSLGWRFIGIEKANLFR